MSLGCSSTKDSATSSSTSDSGKSDGTDDTATEGDAGSGDASTTELEVVNGCKDYFDATGDTDTREIVWDLSVSSTEAHCMAVKAGQTVTFKGDFGSHPLVASGGDSPNAFSSFDSATGKITFTEADKDKLYGYVCGNHPSMMGAIYIVP